MFKRRLTAGEQDELLSKFYEEIYNEDGDFHGDNVARFRDDASDDEETEVVTNENNTDFVADEIDPNLDTGIPIDERDDEVTLPRKQKFRTQRDVCDERNFEKLPEQNPQTFEWSNKNEDSVKWTTNKPSNDSNPNRAGRRAARDLPTVGGPTREAIANSETALSTWQVMISDDLLMKVVNYTNKKINDCLAVTGLHDKNPEYKLTSLTEMKAWFGLLYLRGALKLNGNDINLVFYHESANDIFSATMPRRRFQFLSLGNAERSMEA